MTREQSDKLNAAKANLQAVLEILEEIRRQIESMSDTCPYSIKHAIHYAEVSRDYLQEMVDE